MNPASVADADGASIPPTAVDRLRTLFRSPGPYVSVYLAGSDPTALQTGFGELKLALTTEGATTEALNAIEARLALPVPDYTAGHCVIAASDGTAIVDHGAEPPVHNFGVVDTLPYAGPLLEWDQRRVAHLVVVLSDTAIEVSSFGLDHRSESRSTAATGTEAIEMVASAAHGINARLVILVGEEDTTQGLVEHLAVELPALCRIVTEPPSSDDELADAIVRQVSDHVARTTVDNLRDFRFLRSHDDAVDGIGNTVQGLRSGTAEKILLHDDPNDQRRLWIGERPEDISLERITDYHQARLNDALIRSAVLQGIEVYVIPSTGPTGPEDDTAAITG